MEKPLVLIVDDSVDQRAIARTLLTHHGYQTLEADSAWTAETMIADHRPNVLLLDLRMPLKSGVQLLRDIAPSRAALGMQIVVYSSFAELYADDLARLGVTTVIDKSASPQEFIAIFDGAIRDGQIREEASPDAADAGHSPDAARSPDSHSDQVAEIEGEIIR